MNDLKERLESTVITKTFNISGMPETTWKEVNSFCKEFYGDARWVMVADLVRMNKEDFKFQMLFEEIQELKAEIELLKNKEVTPKTGKEVPTFGKK